MTTLQVVEYFCSRVDTYDAAVVYGQATVTLSMASGDVFPQVRTTGLLGRFYFTILLLCSPLGRRGYLLKSFSGMISE